jgi:hypothetical protein
MAASTALPPFFSTSTPICTASGCAAATIPCRAYTTERVAKERPTGPLRRQARARGEQDEQDDGQPAVHEASSSRAKHNAARTVG